jgi:putative holliday junction resolvase
MPTPSNPTILALDVGGRRIGLAITSLAASLPRPLMTIEQADNILYEIAAIIKREQVVQLVVGYPRNLSGESTGQTEEIERFTDTLREHLDIPIAYQDESVTSKQAEAELISRGRPYKKADIDALAATYILEDYLKEQTKD